MSYATMCIISRRGLVRPYKEYRNSWGWAAHVWMSLCDAYAIKDQYGYGGPDSWRALWRGVESGKVVVEPFERDVLLSTYDNAIVSRAGLPRFAESLRDFYIKHSKPEVASHLLEIANDVLALKKDTRGVCFWATSVAEDPWTEFDDEGDRYVPYSIHRGSKHWFVDVEEKWAATGKSSKESRP